MTGIVGSKLNIRGSGIVAKLGTDGMSLAITYMNATQGWVPTIDEAVTDAPVHHPMRMESLVLVRIVVVKQQKLT